MRAVFRRTCQPIVSRDDEISDSTNNRLGRPKNGFHGFASNTTGGAWIRKNRTHAKTGCQLTMRKLCMKTMLAARCSDRCFIERFQIVDHHGVGIAAPPMSIRSVRIVGSTSVNFNNEIRQNSQCSAIVSNSTTSIVNPTSFPKPVRTYPTTFELF